MNFNYLDFEWGLLSHRTIQVEEIDYDTTRERYKDRITTAAKRAKCYLETAPMSIQLESSVISVNQHDAGKVDEVALRYLEALYPNGIALKQFATAQWKEMTTYIRCYLSSGLPLTTRAVETLLTFNTQYLVKIADYAKKDVGLRDVSILRKQTSYHRDYEADNTLLEIAAEQEQIQYQNALVLLAANNNFKFYLKSTRHTIFLDGADKPHEIVHQIENKLAKFNTTHFNYHIHVMVTSNHNYLSKNNLLELINDTINNYLFLKPQDVTIHVELVCTKENGIDLIVVQDPKFTGIINHAGSTPSLFQASRFYVKSMGISVQKFYDAVVDGTSFVVDAKPLQWITQTPSISPQARLNLLLLDELEKLGKTHKAKNFQIIFQSAANLLKGLKELDLQSAFASTGLERLVFDQMERINYFMEKMLFYANNFIRCENYFDLIVEEITLLLMLAKPYTSHDFLRVLREQLTSSWPSFSAFKMTQSGTECFYDAIKAHKNMNKSLHRKPAVLFFDDIYFEFVNYLSVIKDSYKISASKDTISDQIFSLQRYQISVNALFVDLHTSTRGDRKVQASHDVIAIIEQLFSANILQDNSVITIDNTIGTWNSEEIGRLLRHFERAMAEQKLHFVITKSCHKLDLIGCDKFAAGIPLVFSHPDSQFVHHWNKLPQTVNMESVEFQAYTHFYKTLSHQITIYAERLMKNAERVYQLLDPQVKFSSCHDPKLFGVSKKEDKRTTFFEFSIAPSQLEDAVEKANLSPLFHCRDSFGYRSCTYLIIREENGEKIRISMGLEKKSQVVAISEFFNRYLPGWLV